MSCSNIPPLYLSGNCTHYPVREITFEAMVQSVSRDDTAFTVLFTDGRTMSIMGMDIPAWLECGSRIKLTADSETATIELLNQ